MRVTASGVLLASSLAVATLTAAPAAAWDSGYGYRYAPRYYSGSYCPPRYSYGHRSYRYSGYGDYGAPYRYRYRYSDGYDYDDGYRPYRGYRVRGYGW